MKINRTLVFGTVTAMTAGSALIACIIAFVPLISSNASSAPLLEPLFNTCTYLFSSGVGAIFGLLGSSE